MKRREETREGKPKKMNRIESNMHPKLTENANGPRVVTVSAYHKKWYWQVLHNKDRPTSAVHQSNINLKYFSLSTLTWAGQWMMQNGNFSSFLFPFHLNSDRCIRRSSAKFFDSSILPIPSSSDSKLNSPVQKRKATRKKKHLSDQKTNEMQIFAQLLATERTLFAAKVPIVNSKLQSDKLEFRLTLCCCCFFAPLEFFYIE